MKLTLAALIVGLMFSIPPNVKADDPIREAEYRVCVESCSEASEKSWVPYRTFMASCVPMCLERIECLKHNNVITCRDTGDDDAGRVQ
jgi:hypothetical protein